MAASVQLTIQQSARLRALSSKLAAIEEALLQGPIRPLLSGRQGPASSFWLRLRQLEARINNLEAEHLEGDAKDAAGILQGLEKRIRGIETGLLTLPREASALTQASSNTHRIFQAFASIDSLNDIDFFRVADGKAYYDNMNLLQRSALLQSPSPQHLCKTLLFTVDTAQDAACIASSDPAKVDDLVLVVVPYMQKIDPTKFRQALKSAGILKNNKSPRVAHAERAQNVMGFPFNGVCFLGGSSSSSASIPIVFADVVTKLNPPLIYLGGGEPDIKLLIRNIPDVIKKINGFVLDITEPRTLTAAEVDKDEKLDSAVLASSSSPTTEHSETMTTAKSASGSPQAGSKRGFEGGQDDTNSKRPPSPTTAVDLNLLDIRVGQIRNARLHPSSEKLICEEIDLGEPSGPRSIVSGIQKFYKPSDLIGKRVCVVANLKPASLGGEASNGMVLCASWTDNDQQQYVRVIEPPEEAPVGSRIVQANEAGIVEPANPNAVKKKKIMEQVAQHLQLDETGKVVTFKGSLVGIIVDGQVKPCTVEGHPFAKVY